MNQKITIRDVAKYAGVSPATVSYVLNGVKKVSDETKYRVLEAVKELNYQPNFTAISLSKRKSNMIGVMLPLVDDSLATIFKENHYYSEVISGIEYVSRKNGYDILISGAGNPEDCKNWITKRNLDGLLFLGTFSENLYKEMKTLSTPIVLIDTYEEYAKHYHNIHVDDELGGYLATKHLLQLGHRSIGFVAHRLTNSPVDTKRFIGYNKALAEANISVNQELIFEGHDSSFENGYRMGEKVLALGDKLTAVFATSDILALGIMKALNEHGKQVPHDYSIVGFDDLTISNYSTPSLTTVRQDVFKKGVVSAETLIQAIEGKIQTLARIHLPVEIVKRDSTSKR
ncbi:LacI family DNA-binding transcriptional regulator [Metabacillus iocasae]|uniref:LacI family transcriptional regulator n=1 Tax=Priestia iocasae TaxID=2291674 RepID=A0ABS2QRX3_9BACI|nr:LacI family DNA-binding transcriptional regulator [Metabacillus iocasae]MBM7702208.1 LacI family transcriptional regulator [Metabacillus iocasae]